ncbi:virulence factor Mce family protein [compost metagenome]|jgi:phospholipid/cholesterol/gamma-HCH transport system substrate-binding protein
MQNRINMKARLAFVAFLLISIVAGAIWYFFSLSQYATYQIYTQDSVSGLMVDAPIEFHGVDVGKVKNIRLVNPQSVSILLNIDKTVPISSTSVATITSRGLATRGFTGYVYIALEDVGTNSAPLTTIPGEPYPIIPTEPSKIVTLDTSINQVNESFQALAKVLKSLFDEKTIVSLKQSADNLQQVTKAMAENTKKLDAIVANTERASHRFEPLLESSHDTVRALQTQILPEAHKALSDLENLSSSFTTQVLPEAHKALSNLDKLSSTFSAVTAKINRDPSILIRGSAPPPPGPGEKK